jgi:hypothetical protein
MMSTTGTDTAIATTAQNDDPPSGWALKFNITSIKSDPWRWNKEWEKALHSDTLTSSRHVYSMMGRMYGSDSWEPEKFSQHFQALKDLLCRAQDRVMEDHKLAEKGDFVTAWLLLEEGERKRHLLKGLEEACRYSSLHQDARALCPEITISSLLKQRGRAFVDTIDAYVTGKKKANEGIPYIFPSEWWGKAVGDEPQSLSIESPVSKFALLTLHRNHFICEPLVVHAYCSNNWYSKVHFSCTSCGPL